MKNKEKKVDDITNRNKVLWTLTNKYDDKKIFEELVKEKFDEIGKLTDEINQIDLINILFQNQYLQKKIQ